MFQPKINEERKEDLEGVEDLMDELIGESMKGVVCSAARRRSRHVVKKPLQVGFREATQISTEI